MNMASWCENS